MKLKKKKKKKLSKNKLKLEIEFYIDNEKWSMLKFKIILGVANHIINSWSPYLFYF